MRIAKVLTVGALGSLAVFTACSSNAVDPNTFGSSTSHGGAAQQGAGGAGAKGGQAGNGAGAGVGTGGTAGGINPPQGQGGTGINLMGGVGGGSQVCGSGPDADHDGWTTEEGDCNDCDANVNPGAFDGVNLDASGMPLPDAMQVDEDCSGKPTLPADNLSCDDGLGPVVNDPFDGARAMGLCNVKIADAPPDKHDLKWGVIKSSFSDIAGPILASPIQQSANMDLNFGLLPDFGDNVHVQEGKRLFALSNGEARTPSQPGFLGPPDGLLARQCNFDKGYTSSYPPGFPKMGSCGTTGAAHDGVALDLQIRVPTNATGMKFKFRFFSCEYPMYVCSKFNDVFAVLMAPDPLPAGDPMGDSTNSSADVAFAVDKKMMKNVIGVNNQDFFTACTSGPPGYDNCVGEKGLAGTGFETHGGSAWLQSQVPVPLPPIRNDPNGASAATIYLRFAIWDSDDGILDSTAIVDGFEWITTPGSMITTMTTVYPVPK